MTDTAAAPGPGHNQPPTEPVALAVDRLRTLVHRIERVDEERKALGNDIRDIFLEAKSAGFDTKVLRQVIAIRRKTPAEIEESRNLLDTYMHSLGM